MKCFRIVNKKYQGLLEYLMVFLMVVMISLFTFNQFVFNRTSGQKVDDNFSGAIIKLHDRIVSVISAPVP